MRFERLTLAGWRQFSSIDVSFHPRLTVITGANGAGKSTLLRILSQHFGFTYSLLSTPRQSRDGILRYFAGLLDRYADEQGKKAVTVGTISYTNGQKTDIAVPDNGSVSYNVELPRRQKVEGLFVSSHRPTSQYQRVDSIPTNGISAQQAYQLYNQEMQNRYNNSYTQFSPVYRIKEAIVSMATFGPGNKNVVPNPTLARHFDEFDEILGRLLPASLGYQQIVVRLPDVVLRTRSGEFVLDGASGGLMAVIDLAWQIFLYSRDQSEFTAVIDEPENHLHPLMQRSIMGSLLEAFPGMQLVVATHSPFVVSSVRNSSVYVLQYDRTVGRGQRSVVSTLLDQVNKAGTANEILRTALGVPITMPLWAEDAVEAIARDFSIDTLTPESIRALRERLSNAGLDEYYGEALNKLVRGLAKE